MCENWHIREVKDRSKLDVVYCKNLDGVMQYFGVKKGSIVTGGFPGVKELMQQHNEFKKISKYLK